jgi:hypothetical protein
MKRSSLLALLLLLAATLFTIGCDDDDYAPASKGVVTLIHETAKGEFVIQDEEMTDGPSRLVITYLDGTVKQVVDPDEFAQMIPQQAPPQNYAPTMGHSGLTLSDLLLYSLIFDAFRPAYYPVYVYQPMPRYYSSERVYTRVRTTVRTQYTDYTRQGLAPRGAESAKRMRPNTNMAAKRKLSTASKETRAKKAEARRSEQPRSSPAPRRSSSSSRRSGRR